MRFLLLFTLPLIFIWSCRATKINDQTKESLIKQINEIYQKDQQYAFIPPQELLDKFGFEKQLKN